MNKSHFCLSQVLKEEEEEEHLVHLCLVSLLEFLLLSNVSSSSKTMEHTAPTTTNKREEYERLSTTIFEVLPEDLHEEFFQTFKKLHSDKKLQNLSVNNCLHLVLSPRLQYIDLNDKVFSSLSDVDRLQIPELCPSLKTIQFGLFDKKEFLVRFIHSLKQPELLESLMNLPTYLDDECLSLLFEKCPNLVSIDLSRTQLTTQGMKKFLFSENSPSLKTLFVKNSSRCETFSQFHDFSNEQLLPPFQLHLSKLDILIVCVPLPNFYFNKKN